ncbi:preprotein translocase subunit SecE [Lachnospiraceae bacterium KM106-2]|nr:preprotein translocase subunit SecE [Lachnospiraceae bacterium KM106-2]
MGDTANNVEAAPKKSKFKSLKSEFSKIVWPEKDALVKQTGAVVIASIILGVIIAVVDAGFNAGIDLLLR